jgi:hypothetical protein
MENIRQVIQISTIRVDESLTTQCEYITTALCNDGTIWEIANRNYAEWTRIPDIPQPFKTNKP